MAQTTMARYKQQGSNIDYTPSTAKTAGEVVVLSTGLVGVVPTDIAANQLGALNIDGVWDLPKGTGSGKDILVGEKVWWNPTLGVAIQLASGATLCGVATETAGESAPFVSTKLIPAGAQGT